MPGSLLKKILKYKLLYILIIPGILYYIIFYYIPMFGVIIAFKDYSPFQGIQGIFTSEWIGFENFQRLFAAPSFWQVMRNTLIFSFYGIVFGFPAPIVLALMLNEVRKVRIKKFIQSASYLPEFLSMVVVVGFMHTFLSVDGGILNELLLKLGRETVPFMAIEKYYRGIVVISLIWKQVGWGSIIFLASIANIDVEIYDAAIIDGAGRFKQIWYVTLPSIMHIIIIMLILRIGSVLSVNFEIILLSYSPLTINVADTLDTFVYREGLINMKYSYTTAVGLFKSIVSAILLLGANYIAKKSDQQGIW
jgi:putative aldouronate transport system permease protein